MSTTIYYEKQKGNLCRKHALNAYFGYNKISESDFEAYCKSYDEYIKKRYLVEHISSKRLDIVPSNHLNIISYVLKLHNVPTLYIPINNTDKVLQERKYLSLIDLISDDKFVFIFNKNHIWGLKYHNQEWYSVDSIKGVHKINIYEINTKNVGFIIPRTLKNMKVDIQKNIIMIKKLFYNTTISSYLLDLKEKKILLGDLEYYLGTLIEWLYLLENPKINKLFSWYEEFIVLYESLHSYYLIEKYIPLIINLIFLINTFI